ncbi:MAG: hypothetical protein IKM15_01230 [Peptococcaceae bacterium]|nr:hypothetical protein [Peptococcaceae bacterium]
MSNLIKADYVAVSTAYKLRTPGAEYAEEKEEKKVEEVSVGSELTEKEMALLEELAHLEEEIVLRRQEIDAVVAEAQKEADRIVEEGKKKAASLLREAEQQIAQEKAQALEQAKAQGHKEGHRLGHAEGYEDGVQAAKMENRQIGESLQAVLDNFEENQQRILAKNLDELKYLALEVASKVVHRQLLDDKGLYLGMIRSALNTFKEYRWIDIYLSDEEGLAVYLEENLAKEIAGQSEYINIRPKVDLPPGTCIVETDAGVVDASVSTQLRYIKEALE